MHQVWTHRITTDELYERIGTKSTEYYIRMHTLRWVCVKWPAWTEHGYPVGSEFPTHWGTEMINGRSIERWLKHVSLLN